MTTLYFKNEKGRSVSVSGAFVVVEKLITKPESKGREPVLEVAADPPTLIVLTGVVTSTPMGIDATATYSREFLVPGATYDDYRKLMKERDPVRDEVDFEPVQKVFAAKKHPAQFAPA